MIQAIAVPKDSVISTQLDGAYFVDSFETAVRGPDKNALEIYLDIVGKTPRWIDFLMTVRNRTVAAFGLKNLGRLSNVTSGMQHQTYKVGDRVGIFSILALSEREVIVGDSDKHLNAKVSVYKYFAAGDAKVAVTTVVHLNNVWGRLYLFFVVPVHKIIVRSLLSRLAAAPQVA